MLLDLAFLAQLGTDLGDAEFIAELLELFCSELPARLGAITDAPDVSALREVVHALGSPAASLGAVDLAAACRSIEAEIAGGAAVSASEATARIVPTAQATATAMRDWQRSVAFPGA